MNNASRSEARRSSSVTAAAYEVIGWPDGPPGITGGYGLMQVIAIVGVLAIQIVMLGGIWAALTGSEFLFWSFDKADVGAAALILFVADPIAMTVGGLVFSLVGAAFSAGRSER
jgi:hypothetical protein